MGDLKEFSKTVRLSLSVYPWRRIDPVPWVALEKKLSRSRVALISTAGFVLPGQEPFNRQVKGGDYSFREIPWTTDPGVLIDTHRSEAFDHGGMQRDPDLAFPLSRIRELADEGTVGSVAPRHLSFMGSITAPGRLVRKSAPQAARILKEDGADAALLVPV